MDNLEKPAVKSNALSKLAPYLPISPWRRRPENAPHTPRVGQDGGLARDVFDPMSIEEVAAKLKQIFGGDDTPRLCMYFEKATERAKIKIASAMLLLFENVGQHIEEWRGAKAGAFRQMMHFTDPAFTYEGCPLALITRAQGMLREMMELAPSFEHKERLEIIRAIEQVRVIAPNEQWKQWYGICGDWSRYLVFSGMCRNGLPEAFDWLAALPKREEVGNGFLIFLPTLVADYGIDAVREQCKKLSADPLRETCLDLLGNTTTQQEPSNSVRLP